MSVNNYSDENKVFIKIKTNAYTFDKNKDKNHTLLIQKNNQVNLIDFYFKSLSNDIIIDKAALFKGVNILSILDQNNNAIAERVIYNHVKNTSKIVLEKSGITKDTLLIKGYLKDKIANFSISVLPTETISSFDDDAITSQLNFNNYLTDKLENYSYYFNDLNRKKQFELDLVLLNQEVPKYNWNTILTQKPTIKYPFDIGITIEGTLNQTISNKDNYNVVLSSIGSGINIPTKIDAKNNFVFENIVAIDSTSFFISLVDNKSKYQAIKLYSKVSNNKNKFLKTLPTTKTKCVKTIFTSIEGYNSDFPYQEGTIKLKEVDLVGVVKEKFNNDNEIGNKSAQKYKITENELDLYTDVLGFIQSHGYQVSSIGGDVRITNRLQTTFKGSTSPVVFVDGAILSDLSFLYNLNLKDIDEIYINKFGFGQGMNGSNGTIKIYTKKIYSLYRQDNKALSKSLIIKDGFQKEIPFKNPIYSFYETQSFKKYGTINWIPNLYTNDDGSFEFTIPILKQKSVLINIQGIDNKGDFYYENIVIDLN